MKKRIIYIFISLFIIILILFSFTKVSSSTKIKISNDKDDTNKQLITKYQKEYNNSDIKAILKIDDILLTPIVQTTDNNYYLKHDINKNENNNGEVFLDYRIKDDSKKIIIYGHNNPNGTLPLSVLEKYKDEDFYKNHSLITLYTINKTYKFKIFTSYVETSDFDYLNLNSFNGTYENHLNKLKNKSLYNTNTKINSKDKIIILQTCSYESLYKNYKDKYRLVMGIKQ